MREKLFAGVHGGVGGHLDDVTDGAIALENMHGLGHAHEDRADSSGAAEFGQEFEGDVSAGHIGEDQRICGFAV